MVDNQPLCDLGIVDGSKIYLIQTHDAKHHHHHRCIWRIGSVRFTLLEVVVCPESRAQRQRGQVF